MDDFSSANARQLSVDEFAGVLSELPYVKAFLAGEHADEI
jgi:hypothetical protein